MLPLADDREIIVGGVQHPGVIAGDLRTAQDDANVWSPSLQLARDPERALNIPKIASESHKPGIAPEEGFDKGMVAERVCLAGGEDVDGVKGAEAFPLREQFQVSRGKGDVAANRRRPERRNGELYKQDIARGIAAHGSYCTGPWKPSRRTRRSISRKSTENGALGLPLCYFSVDSYCSLGEFSG